jgi:hypothetical protein
MAVDPPRAAAISCRQARQPGRHEGGISIRSKTSRKDRTMHDRDHDDPKRHKHISVFALFDDEESLSRAVGALKAGGFPGTDISALLPDRASTRAFAHEKHTKAPEGAAAGAAAGAVTGGTLGLLLGLGSIAIPGLGAFLAAGPIVGALAGVGAGGAVGSLTGALIGLGIPEYEAKRYESHLHAGGALVSVHCDDDDAARRARSILDGFGGTDIDETREARARLRRDEHHPNP